MKKNEIILVIVLVFFGLIYQAVEKGKARFVGDFSIFSSERKLKGSHFSEFPEPEKLFAAIERVAIDNPAGEIVIGPATDGQVHLVSLLRVYYTDKGDVEEVRKKAEIKADLEGGALKISVQHRSPFPYQRLRVLFRLLVPENTLLAVSNQEGDVVIKDTGKEIRVDLANGSLFLERVRSRLELQLKNCNANIKDIAGHAEITASHSNIVLENAASLRLAGKHGDCTLKNAGKDVLVEYSFGRLTLDEAGKVEISARHSDISASNIRSGAVVANKYGNILLEDISGDVRLSSRSCGIDLRRVSGGSVMIDNSYADTRIQDFSGDNLDMLVKNGSLDLGVKGVAGRINIQSQHAELNLVFGVLPDPAFSIRTKQGRITIESPLEFETYEENEVHFANRTGLKPEILVNNTYGSVHVKTAM